MKFHHFRKSRHDPQKTLENEASTLCPQVRTNIESCRNEMETESGTVTGTVMVTEWGTEAGTKVEIEPECEEENRVEIMEQKWKQHNKLFDQIEAVTEWESKENVETDNESGIDEEQTWVDHDWDSELPSDDPDKLMTLKTLMTLLPVPRLAKDYHLDTGGDSEVSDEDETMWRKKIK